MDCIGKEKFQNEFSPYQVLGVSCEASYELIRREYIQRVRLYHSDKTRTSNINENAEMIRRITTSFNILKDDQTRSLFDRTLKMTSSIKLAWESVAVFTSKTFLDDCRTEMTESDMRKELLDKTIKEDIQKSKTEQAEFQTMLREARLRKQLNQEKSTRTEEHTSSTGYCLKNEHAYKQSLITELQNLSKSMLEICHSLEGLKSTDIPNMLSNNRSFMCNLSNITLQSWGRQAKTFFQAQNADLYHRVEGYFAKFEEKANALVNLHMELIKKQVKETSDTNYLELKKAHEEMKQHVLKILQGLPQETSAPVNHSTQLLGDSGKKEQLQVSTSQKSQQVTQTGSTASLYGKKRIKKGPFMCRICENTFTMLTALYRHIRHKHQKSNTSNLKETCFKCNKRFSRLDSLKRHLKSQHTVKYGEQRTKKM